MTRGGAARTSASGPRDAQIPLLDQPTGIQVTTRRPLALSTFRQVRLQVDAGPIMIRPWGTTFLPAEPGTHVVRCWYPRSFFLRAGDASMTVEVPAAGAVSVEYSGPAVGWDPGVWSMPNDLGRSGRDGRAGR